MKKSAIEGYGRGALESEIQYASPHRIIQMLMEGALTKLAAAKGCVERGDTPEKGRQITWAINIINGLRSSLDMDKGEAVASNLDALYEYMEHRLLEAHAANDVAILNEVIKLLMEVKSGWDQIPQEFR